MIAKYGSYVSCDQPIILGLGNYLMINLIHRHGCYSPPAAQHAFVTCRRSLNFTKVCCAQVKLFRLYQ